jgi:transposase
MVDPTCPSSSLSPLDEFCRLDRLGLTVTGVARLPDKTVLACDVVQHDEGCPACGGDGIARGSVKRLVTHVPYGWWPTVLSIRVRCLRCGVCGHVWRQDTTKAVARRGKLSRDAVTWALRALVMDHLSVSRVAADLGVTWNTANTAVLTAGAELLIADPSRFDGVRVIGVDEHVWRHTRFGDTFVTVVIDLTPVRDKTGSARLLDMVPGRSKQVFKAWLARQPQVFRDGVSVVAMDGFTGYKSAAVEELPDAVEVMDPFHVVALAGDKLEKCRQRVQQEIYGHRGRAGEPLYTIRRALHTGTGFLTQRQATRIDMVFTRADFIAVEVTWSAYQHVMAAYRETNPVRGKAIMARVIHQLTVGVPKGLAELAQLGRTLNKRKKDILAYFDHPGCSNGPTEAINGRLEHLRGIALGFRNLANYIARSLLETGGLKPALHPQL